MGSNPTSTASRDTPTRCPDHEPGGALSFAAVREHVAKSCEVIRMLEPQGTVFFLILMVVFAALLTWLVIAKHAVFRVLAACLAFIQAMLFGVAAVNRYYNYYQTWGSIVADFTNQGVASVPQVPHLTGKEGVSKLGLSPPARSEATETG